ncbi:OmpA family protein [Aliikangiella coralliicola]|uniref:OmpA family protein n=1 Tax=Aliikangiella coralliicola TaxID=2592383 RepID=A0A545UIR3_9GAMM|nr:OmpA family protein [Aliikangiella coralliicola]TQV89352.1 OmpA family protein [Aliikangiella coralliicola]
MVERQSAAKKIDNGREDTDEYQRLRTLLLGDEYEQVIRHRITQGDIQRVANVLSEAFHERNSKDQSLASEMSPVIESAIDTSIKNNPSRITNVIFPIIGPAVRKAVASALADMMHSLNHLLQQSLTAQALIWRIKAWRLGVPYAQYAILQTIQYRVEQIFLIHRETSLLLQSCSAEGVSYQDPDLVSSMLTAITDFASDSFNQESDSLNVIQFGELTLLIESGPFAILAFAVRGAITSEVKQRIIELIENIHTRYASQLEHFDGDITPFEECHSTLTGALMQKKKVKAPQKPWLAISLVSAATLVALFFGYQHWQQVRTVEQFISEVEQEPGYQLLGYRISDNQLVVNTLRSPSAISVEDMKARMTAPEIKVKIIEKVAAIENPNYFLPTLTQKYGLDLKFEFIDNNRILSVTGKTTPENLQQLKQDPMATALFDQITTDNLVILEPEPEQLAYQRQFRALVNDINNQFFYFESATTQLKESSRKHLEQTIVDLKSLVNLQQKSQLSVLQITVSGYADGKGTNEANQILSEQRANLIKSILQANGIENELIISWGLGVKDLEKVPLERQRRVGIQVLYQEYGANQ